MMEQPTPADAISADELAYHHSVLMAVVGPDALRASWLGHLTTKYGLNEGDQITSGGAILRHAGGDGGGPMPLTDLDHVSEQLYFVTGSVGTTAVPLGSSTQSLTELVIQADPDNAEDILIGGAASQGWRLVPGAEFACPIRNPGLIYGKTTGSTATYSLFGRYGQ